MQNPMYGHWLKNENPQWGFYQNFKLHSKLPFFPKFQSPNWIGYFCLKPRKYKIVPISF